MKIVPLYLIIWIMNSIFLFFITAYIIYFLFRPVTKKEIEKFENPDNWSNMGF